MIFINMTGSRVLELAMPGAPKEIERLKKIDTDFANESELEGTYVCTCQLFIYVDICKYVCTTKIQSTCIKSINTYRYIQINLFSLICVYFYSLLL
jgi:hypothetical protein